MKVIDLQKQTAVVTSAATITLGAAVAPFRTIAQAIAAGDLLVGQAGVAFFVRDPSSGVWESGLYTITSSTTLTQDRRVGSSNNGAAVAFAGASCEVYCAGLGAGFNDGLVNPDDVAFLVVGDYGQSNTAGRGVVDALVDASDPRVWQYGCDPGNAATYQKITQAVEPLSHTEGSANTQLGPGLAFARALAATLPTNYRILLVPCAVGSTSLVGSVWAAGNPGGSLYENAITRTNAAIAAAKAIYPNSRFAGFYWGQCEGDAINGVSQPVYADGLKAVIAGIRSRVTGAANSWTIINGMVPEWVASNVDTTSTNKVAIQQALIQVAQETDRCAYNPGVSGYANGVHYLAQGYRILGARAGLLVQTAKGYSAVIPPATAVTLSLSAASTPVGGPITVTVGVDHPLTGSQSESVTLSAPVAGNWSQNPVTLNAGAQSASPTFTSSATGTGNITAAATGTPTLTGASQAFTATAAATVPAAPTIGTAVAGDGYVDVYFTRNGNGGSAVIDSTATLSTGQTATGASSPIRVTAPNGTAVTATVTDRNAVGSSPASAGSNSVTPTAATVTYATMSTTDKDASITLSGGNLIATGSVAGFRSARGNVGKATGKLQFEAKLTAGTSVMVGFGGSAVSLTSFVGSDATGDSYGYYSTGTRYYKNSQDAVQATYTTNDVIGVVIDLDAKTAQFYKNGVGQGQFSLNLSYDPATTFPMITTNANGAQITLNFGATAFSYPVAGYSGWTV